MSEPVSAVAGARVLVIDDERDMCEMLETALSLRGYRVCAKTSAEDALDWMEGEELDVVLTDLNLGAARMSGIDLCQQLRNGRPDIPTVVMTAFGSLDSAVAALRAGAYDFITKPVNNDLVALSVDRAARHKALSIEVRRLRREVEQREDSTKLIGSSAAMRRLQTMLERVSKSSASVLITGESGTGKELAARAIHDQSARCDQPFVAVNCAAMPEALLESELFGHTKGAFTDAHAVRSGLFVRASGGTLFFDEIGELPLALQPKLLRAIQERKIRPVGGDDEIDVDVRFIAATNRDLEAEVEEKRFREDLYFRVNVIHVALPPLRSRGGDILVLAQHYIDHFARTTDKAVRGVGTAAAERLLQYPWPGNVRELQNCIERAVALTEYDELTVEDLPERVRKHSSTHVVVASSDPTDLVSLAEVERRYILKVLDAAGGNKTMAGRILGLDRKTLYRKLERWGVTSTPE